MLSARLLLRCDAVQGPDKGAHSRGATIGAVLQADTPVVYNVSRGDRTPYLCITQIVNESRLESRR